MNFDEAMRGAIELARALPRPEADSRVGHTARTVAAFVREKPGVGLQWRTVVQAVAEAEDWGHEGNLTGQRELRISRSDWEGIHPDRIPDATAIHERAVAIFGDFEGSLDPEKLAAFYRALPNSEPWEREVDGVPPMGGVRR